jgi:hypothetical protein
MPTDPIEQVECALNDAQTSKHGVTVAVAVSTAMRRAEDI